MLLNPQVKDLTEHRGPHFLWLKVSKDSSIQSGALGVWPQSTIIGTANMTLNMD